MILNPHAVRKTWYFLGAITVVETLIILLQLKTVAIALTLHATEIPLAGWILAAVVALTTILYTARALNLWPLLAQLGGFKALGLLIAIPSSILEEAVFRMTVMNVLALQHYGVGFQIAASAVTFGAVHAVWAVRGGVRSLMTAVISMTVLGAALAVVYVVSGRALLPCVVAHFVINLVLEPWLGYAYALRDQRTQVA